MGHTDADRPTGLEAAYQYRIYEFVARRDRSPTGVGRLKMGAMQRVGHRGFGQ